MFGSIFDVVGDFVEDPIGTVVDVTLQPVRDSINIIDGLTEGELRERAVIRLGADIAGGMVLSELLDWYQD